MMSPEEVMPYKTERSEKVKRRRKRKNQELNDLKMVLKLTTEDLMTSQAKPADIGIIMNTDPDETEASLDKLGSSRCEA